MAKRIAMISYHTCPLASREGKETGGLNIYVLELSKELARAGHTVDIFTRSTDPNNEEIVHVEENLRVIHIPAGPQTNLSKKDISPYIDEFVDKFVDFTKNENTNYDALHCHYYLSGEIGIKIKQKITIPVIVSFHTLALMKNLVARSETEKEDPSRIKAEFDLMEKADGIISSSETESLYMQYLYNGKTNKISVVPPGVDKTRFHRIEKSKAKQKVGLSQDEKIVLFVGRIEPLKGIDALIYAMKIIVTRCPKIPVRLLIVGGDVSQDVSLWKTELRNLEELRQVLNIPNIVDFADQSSQEKLVYYYNSAEVVVMPSHYESFGMTALEAMACGVPVIASNVSGIANIIDEKHDFLITSVNNPLLLASQIENLLNDDALHAKVSREIIENIEDFSWSATANKTLATYESIR